MSKKQLTVEEVRENLRIVRYYMVGLAVVGSAILIVYTFQNKTSYIDENGKKVQWNHPFYSAFVTVIGQACTGLLYLAKKRFGNSSRNLSSKIDSYGTKEALNDTESDLDSSD